MIALRVAGGDDLHRRDPPETANFDICSGDDNGFPDFSDANALLDGIDFDDLFVGMDGDDGDVLPDLELLADFSVAAAGGEEDKGSGSGSGSDESSGGEEIASKRTNNNDKGIGKNGNFDDGNNNNLSTPKDQDQDQENKSRKSSSKNSHGKRKVKVDWTPELHRRFVQAVEQLGVDKAVPSRILELMGIDCLTRHNIASHLQKYRSHRKHLLAREAEAASWTQRRQMYGAGGKRPDPNPWLAQPPARPTMGFPPMAAPPHAHHFRPLHVWGHPSADQSAVHTWPKRMSPPWAQPEPPFWHHQRVRGGALTPCFPQALPPMRFGAPPVQGYKVGHGGAGRPGPPHPRPLIDDQPSKESIDAAIGDVLSKPWLPLPLGLKPPSTDSVMVELHRHGVPKIPPATKCA